jgi:transposase
MRSAGKSYDDGMLAHLLVSKYCDICRCTGRATFIPATASILSDWVGQAVWLLQPIVDGTRNHAFAAEKLHANDTPVPVLEPGLGPPRT